MISYLGFRDNKQQLVLYDDKEQSKSRLYVLLIVQKTIVHQIQQYHQLLQEQENEKKALIGRLFFSQRRTLGIETLYILFTPRKLERSLYARKISSLRSSS